MKNNSKKIIVEDIEYLSLSDACKVYNLKPETVSWRLLHGWTVEEAFGLVIKKTEKNKSRVYREVSYKGVKYPSVSKACSEIGVNRDNIVGKLRRGYTFEESVDMYLEEKRQVVFVDGIKFKNLSEACKYFSTDSKLIRLGTIFQKVSNGCSYQEAFDSYRYGDVIVFGRRFKDIKSVCEHYNVSSSKVKTRRSKGYTLEEAIKDIIGVNKIKVAGKEFLSYMEACVCFNENYSSVMSRLNNCGWSLEEALSLTPRLVDDRIDKISWNMNKKIQDVKILVCLDNGYYKCSVKGSIRYYSQVELFKVFENEVSVTKNN